MHRRNVFCACRSVSIYSLQRLHSGHLLSGDRCFSMRAVWSWNVRRGHSSCLRTIGLLAVSAGVIFSLLGRKLVPDMPSMQGRNAFRCIGCFKCEHLLILRRQYLRISRLL
ncbi:MAG: hypothetical protein ACK55Z_34380 [bacterium]